jgi:hypothetical protein
LDAKKFVNALNGVLIGKPDGNAIGESIESLVGCVGDLLGEMLKDEATE